MRIDSAGRSAQRAPDDDGDLTLLSGGGAPADARRSHETASVPSSTAEGGTLSELARENAQLARHFERDHDREPDVQAARVRDVDQTDTGMQASGVQAGAATAAVSAEGHVWATDTGSAAATGTATATATATATTSAGPTASPQLIAFHELMLADPLLQDVVGSYGQPLPASLPSNASTDALVAQFGTDLTGRMLQASTAITRVFGEYCAAMDQAATGGPEGGASGWVFTPGTQAQGELDGTPGTWTFHPEIFTADYAQGTSLAARAFASFHGTDGGFARITRTLAGTSDAGDIFSVTSGGIDPDSAQFKWQDSGDAGGEMRWEGARMGRNNALVQIDLNDPLQMFDPEAVWFDSTLGFVTANENIVPEKSTAETIVITAVIGVVTWGIGSVVCSGVGVATASAAGGAILGATGAVVGGLFQSGTVRFEDVVRGAIVGAIGGKFAEHYGNAGLDPKTGAVVDWGARLGSIGGRAGLQGLLTELSGGDFKDGFLTSLATSAASEVGRTITAEINGALAREDITPEQANAYRSLGRVVTTAVGALGSPNERLAGFAAQFLEDTFTQEIAGHTTIGSTRVLASVTAEGEASELDFGGVVDGLLETDATGNSTAAADGGATTELDTTTTGGHLTEREQQGIEQSDEILARHGDELAEANGLNPVRLPDGRLQYPDGRILTPGGETVTDASPDPVNASAYSSQYRHVPATQGVPPVGGFENLTPAPDLPELPPEATPTLHDGRHGSSVAYRDQVGNVFYATYDADGKPVRWLSAEPAAMLVSPGAARAAGAVLAAELRSGNPVLVAAAGATLVGTSWWLLSSVDDPWSNSQALPPEQVSNDTRPTILVPVSPGPAGTPGQVRDDIDTSTPSYQSPDSQSTSTTTLPATPAQNWRELIVNSNARNSDGTYGDIPAEHRWRYDRYLSDPSRATHLSPNNWYESAQRVWENNSAGNGFEQAVRGHLGTLMGGGSKPVSIDGFVPDLPVGQQFGVTDVKDHLDLTNSDQLRAFYDYATENNLSFNIIISPRTQTISEPLLDNIRSSGGSVMQFDPASNELTPVDIGPSGPWTRSKP